MTLTATLYKTKPIFTSLGHDKLSEFLTLHVYNAANGECRSYFRHTKDTPKLFLRSELWDVFREWVSEWLNFTTFLGQRTARSVWSNIFWECFEEYWPYHNRTGLCCLQYDNYKEKTKVSHKTCPILPSRTNTEMRMLSFWRNFHHRLHQKLSKWQLSVQLTMKTSIIKMTTLPFQCSNEVSVGATLQNNISIYRELILNWFNSLWPSDAMWRHRSGSTLAQVMACCLTAPSHYLNQCWLMISEVLWHWSDSNFTENT